MSELPQGLDRRHALLDQQIGILPSSLLLDSDKGSKSIAGVIMKPVFCPQCGRPTGMVSEDTIAPTFLCQACQETPFGLEAGLMVAAPEVDMAEHAQRLMEKYPKLESLAIAAAMAGTPEAEAAVAAELAAVLREEQLAPQGA